MAWWDEDGCSDIGYTVLYYCTICEEYFDLSPISPLRCPTCFCDARYIVGPMRAKNIDLDELIRRQKKKYGHAMRR